MRDYAKEFEGRVAYIRALVEKALHALSTEVEGQVVFTD